MRQGSISRRVFLAATSAATLATLAGCGRGQGSISGTESSGGGVDVDSRSPVRAYRLSTRGKRASNAAKSHAANMLFVSMEVADARRAHPGDKSAIVSLDISKVAWNKYFGNGRTEFDLRADKVAAEQLAKCTKQVTDFEARISGRSLVIETLAGVDGKLFGSVTALMISTAFKTQFNEDVDRKLITTAAPIKELGSYEVNVRFPCNLFATVPLDVVAQST